MCINKVKSPIFTPNCKLAGCVRFHSQEACDRLCPPLGLRVERITFFVFSLCLSHLLYMFYSNETKNALQIWRALSVFNFQEVVGQITGLHLYPYILFRSARRQRTKSHKGMICASRTKCLWHEFLGVCNNLNKFISTEKWRSLPKGSETDCILDKYFLNVPPNGLHEQFGERTNSRNGTMPSFRFRSKSGAHCQIRCTHCQVVLLCLA